MSRLQSPLITLEDSPDAFYDFMDREFTGDGFPAVEPTPERVEAMIAAGGRPADEVVGILEPRMGVANVEAVATNAVMAGCRPEYFPVVLATLESALASGGMATHAATTNSLTPFIIINGPARHELKVNFQESCFGVAGRANATIGRALRLCMINIAGLLPGPVSKSVFGQPGRYTMCIGEWDERNPWEPLHVQRGFKREQNCVTVVSASTFMNITDIWSHSGESYLLSIARSINTVAGGWVILQDAEITIVLNPAWAELLSGERFSLQEVRNFLWEKSQVPLSQFPADYEAPLRELGAVLDGDLVCQTNSPDKFNVIVAGGMGGLHAIACHGMGIEKSVTLEFTIPSERG